MRRSAITVGAAILASLRLSDAGWQVFLAAFTKAAGRS